MERSESIKELSKALVEFHKKVGKVIKDAKGNIPTKSGSSYSYRYATLSNILDVIQEPLNECGLTVIQLPTAEFELETMLTHVSGEYIVSRYLMRPTQNNPQGIGSCITYQRRYAIGAILGLNIDEDDDAAAALYGAYDSFRVAGLSGDADETALMLKSLYPQSRQAKNIRI